MLAETLERPEPAVVSVGGGAVLDPGNRTRLRSSGTVVWLRARPETLARRVGRAANRPLLNDHAAMDTVDVLRRIDAERRPLYEEVADVIVDVDTLGLEAVADRVARALSPDPGAAVPGEPR